jgi:hypothetical protein
MSKADPSAPIDQMHNSVFVVGSWQYHTPPQRPVTFPSYSLKYIVVPHLPSSLGYGADAVRSQYRGTQPHCRDARQGNQAHAQ